MPRYLRIEARGCSSAAWGISLGSEYWNVADGSETGCG